MSEFKDYIKANGGVFNVRDLARELEWGDGGDFLHSKAKDLNGKLNYDREEKTLTIDQLRILFPVIAGSKGFWRVKEPAKGNLKRFCEDAGIDLKPTKEKQQKSLTVHERRAARPKRSVVEEMQTGFNRYKLLVFVVALSGIFWQAMHFAHLEDAASPLNGNFSKLSAFGIALGFESLVMILTVKSDKDDKITWVWLGLFFVIAVFMNLSYYGVIESEVVKKVILSIALPFSILATTHLYINEKKKRK